MNRSIILSAIALLCLMACAGGASNPATSLTPLTGSTWMLREIGDRKIADDSRPWIVLEADGVIRGFTGCNLLRGSYTLENEKLSVGPLAMTRRACLDSLNALETDMLRAMQTTDTLTREGDTLRLTGAGEPLAFTPGAPAGSAGAQ